jgi:benzoate-CoA ligase family protein
VTLTVGQASGNAVERFVLSPAAADPGSTLVIDAPSGQSWTRAEIADRVTRAAGVLAARGVQPEQRVLLVVADTPDFLAFFWGAMWLGAVPVPVSTMLTEADYRFLLDDSRAVGLVLSAPFVATAGAATSDQRHLRFVLVDGDGELPPGATRVDDALAAASDAPAPFAASSDDVAFWLYTSGTTGFPKGARHRHVDLGFCTDAYARGVLEMTADDRVYSVAKLFFAYGLGNAGYFPADTGACAILNPGRPDPHAVAEHVRTHRPTLFFGVPTFYAALLNADLPDDTFSSVRLGVSAGEPLPADIHRRFRERFGIEVLDGIGTTEILHIFVSNRPGRSVGGTSGTPVDGYEIELRDAIGALVPDGEPGNLWVAGESLTTGYWNRTAQNRAVLHGRFMATGDEYVRNADGSYTYLGRSDDMLKVGGIWVSPAEVEACIVELDAVVQCAVVGADPGDGLVKPRAFVVAAVAGASADLPAQVQAHVKDRLAPYKYPRWVEVVDELPTTATGKVKRYLLRQRPLPETEPNDRGPGIPAHSEPGPKRPGAKRRERT